MFDSMGELISIIGFVIVTMIGVIAFWLKKWMADREAMDKKILASLENIKDQIHTLQTENQLQRQTIHEMDSRLEVRFQGIDRRLDKKHGDIGGLGNRVMKLESMVQKICVYHKHNHPDDDID